MNTPQTNEARDIFEKDGYYILENLIPEPLLSQLQREAAKATDLARDRYGPQARRFQPIQDHLDLPVFNELAALPRLKELLYAISDDMHLGVNCDHLWQNCAILIEPQDRVRSTYWHRDWRDRLPIDEDRWLAAAKDIRLLNAYTCALYTDDSLWVVPGSHDRDDLDGEAPFRANRYKRWSEWDDDWCDGPGAEVDTKALMAYAESMPGARRITLQPGDFLLWKSSLWHFAYYDPGKIRASIHDSVGCPANLEWMQMPVA